MKELIEEQYGLKIKGIIKMSSCVYKIKCDDHQYILKIVDDLKLKQVLEYIDALAIECFVDVYYNKNKEILTKYENKYLFLMPCMDLKQSSLKEYKLKFYFEILAYLHTKSIYYMKVNHDYFDTLQKDIIAIIDERKIYYEKIIENCEKIIFRSPSQWMMLLNYYRIYESLNKAIYYLKEYMKEIQNNTQIRVSLVYKNFHYDHIALKQRKLLSINRMQIDMPIYDLFDMYQKIPDILFDLDCFSIHYFSKVELNKEEKLLLCALMHIVPVVRFENDEIENIIKLSRLLYYLDSISGFIQQMSLTL